MKWNNNLNIFFRDFPTPVLYSHLGYFSLRIVDIIHSNFKVNLMFLSSMTEAFSTSDAFLLYKGDDHPEDHIKRSPNLYSEELEELLNVGFTATVEKVIESDLLGFWVGVNNPCCDLGRSVY